MQKILLVLIYLTNFIDDFSDLDIKYIQDFDISIYFIDENIYYDNTLEIIKFKFLKYYNQSISPPLQAFIMKKFICMD